jgi:hypothetical protein
MPAIDLSILNQRQTPAFYADTLANRPAAGFVGRIFVSTNTFAFFRDNGTGWDLIGGPGTGTITGAGTANTFTIFTGASTIGDSSYLTQAANAINVASASLILPSNNTVGGTNYGISQVMATNDFWSIFGNTIALNQSEMVFQIGDDQLPYPTSGNRFRFSNSFTPTGTSNKDLFIIDYDVSYFNTSLGINTDTPTAAFDVHSGVNVIAQLNQTVATNNSLLAFQNAGSGLWRIGNFYNAGANDFGISDVIGGIEPLRIKKTTGQVLIGTNTVGSGKLVVASAIGDNGVQIVGAAAPSLRIDNAESGPTKRAGLGISTATNNFIQGSADRDFCMFNGSTTASPILFGIYGTTNVQEAARISPARNFIIGTVTDQGQKFQVSGTTLLSGNTIIRSASTNQLTLDGGTTVQSRIVIARGSDDNAQGMTIGYSNITSYRTSTPLASPQTDFSLNQQGSDGTRTVLYMSSAGNIGIQTNAPATPLEVLGVNEGEYFRGGGGTISDRSLRLSNYTISGTVGIGHRINNPNSGGSLNFAINSADAIIIRNTGNVLINSTNDNGSKLQVTGSIYSSGQVTYSNNGNIQHLTDTVAASATRTYTISGNVRGFIQILIGVFGNGSGSTSRAIFFGGGDLSNSMPYTEVLRVNGGTTTISAVTTNATTTTFTIQNLFAFNIANVEISVISGTAISNPVITAS